MVVDPRILYPQPASPEPRPAAPSPWSGFNSPEAQAALMQFGLQLMTPQYGGFGRNLGYNLGGALSAAGRVGAQREKRKRQEAEDQLSEREMKVREQNAQSSQTSAQASMMSAQRRAENRGQQGLTPYQQLSMQLGAEREWQSFITNQAKAAASSDLTLEKQPVDFLNDPVWVKSMQDAYVMAKQSNPLLQRQPSVAPQAQESGVSPGTIATSNGRRYRFKGGDSKDRKNWEPI